MAFAPTFAAAQESDVIVVRAARLPPPPGEGALSVIRLGPQQLTASGSLDRSLTNQPGVQLFRRTSSAGANPTTQGISLRGVAGSGAGRALVTLDGAPQNDPFGGWVIWSALPPEILEGATIVRGAGSGPYGAGALTGVIALDERASVPGGIAGEITYGEQAYRRGAGVAQADAGAVRVFAALSGEDGGGWIPVRRGRGAADRLLTVEDWSGALRVSADLGRATVAARYSQFDEVRGSGLAGANSEAQGKSASLTIAAPPSADELGWRLQAWWRQSDLLNTSVSVAAGRATTTPANNQYETPADGYGLNAAFRKAGEALSLEVGADVRWADGEDHEYFRFVGGSLASKRIAGGKTMVGGVYGEASYTSGPWLITGGARVDGWQSTDAKRIENVIATGVVTLNSRAADASGTVPTGRFAVRHDLGDGLYARVGAYAGFRPATLNELHRPFRVGNDVTEANPGLSPEKLYGVEFGLGGDSAVAWSVNAFANQLKDAITNVTVGGPGTYPIAGFIPAGGVLRQRQNAGEINAYGIEGEIKKQFAGRVMTRAAFTYTRAEVDGKSVAPQLTGLRPAQTPLFSAAAGADWRVTDRFSTSLDLTYESQRYDDDQNTRGLAPSLTTNIRADYKLGGGVSIYGALDNVTDEAVETGQTADGIESFGPPRRFRIGLVLRR
jgi:outer membrane receptor protein involved in Fe transport